MIVSASLFIITYPTFALTHWLSDWLTHWLSDWLTHWLSDWLSDCNSLFNFRMRTMGPRDDPREQLPGYSTLDRTML